MMLLPRAKSARNQLITSFAMERDRDATTYHNSIHSSKQYPTILDSRVELEHKAKESKRTVTWSICRFKGKKGELGVNDKGKRQILQNETRTTPMQQSHRTKKGTRGQTETDHGKEPQPNRQRVRTR